MSRWWQQTDGELGMTWRGAIVSAIGATIAVGAWYAWVDDRPIDEPFTWLLTWSVGTVWLRYDLHGRMRRAIRPHRSTHPGHPEEDDPLRQSAGPTIRIRRLTPEEVEHLGDILDIATTVDPDDTPQSRGPRANTGDGD